MRKGVALDRVLSKLGYVSRAQAGRLIYAGKVSVNGRVITDPRSLTRPEHDRIAVDGASPRRERWTLLALHKPRGVVTTRSDPEGRTTVYEFLTGAVRVVPVGRLDYASSGLLLFTNDTHLADWLTDPATGLIRRYVVTVRGELLDETAKALEAGVLDRGAPLKAAAIEVLKRSKRETHLVVELTEGKNREIRRMMKSAGHEVTRLKRIAFGGLELGDLAPGKWRTISEQEARAAFPNGPIRTRGRANHLRQGHGGPP
jgi:23S rRNA pseudouridine2605 synthase